MAKVQSLENYLQSHLTAETQECEKLNKADKSDSEILRVNFAILYLQLQQTVTFTEFSELSVDDLLQIEKLKLNAAKVYTSIVSARQLGKDYLFAAFTYFATYVSEQLDETGYLLLRVSYLFYKQYQAICPLTASDAKQKEICDLLRYICKPLVELGLQQQEESSEESSEESDSRRLLERYLDFMLNLVQFNKEIYENWTEFIQDFSLKEKKFSNYLRALTIIFKRLADKKIVYRKIHRKIRRKRILQRIKAKKRKPRKPRPKKLKPVPDWPSQEEEVEKDYPSQGKITLSYFPADITFDPWIVIDEEGEIDAIEQGWQIETTDPGTGRFFRFVNEYATHMLRHRQRRLQPLVTNSYYMSQDVIQHLFYLLNGELNSQDPDSSAMAAACLLSLSSGLSPVALLNYEQLIEKGVLLKTGSAKRPEYQVRLYLAITQQKNESLMPHQLNHMVSHELYLSSSWFEYLHLRCSTSPVTVQEVNQYLKKCIAGQQLGSITVEKLQAQLYFHVFHHTFNEYIAHVLSGKDSSHDLPGSFYGGVAKKQLNEKYRIYLNTLCRPDTEAGIKIVEQQFESSSEADTTRLGSQLALTPDFVSDFFQQLHKVCHEKIQLHQHLIERINAYSLWMWHISLLCLTRRPQEHLLGECSAYDLDLRLLYVNDKKNSQSRKDGRFIPLAKFFTQAFKHYLDFLNSVVTHYADLLKFVFKKHITLEDLFGKVIVYSGSLPVTAQAWDSPKIRIKPLSRAWVNEALSRYVSAPIYNNWLRHFAMNMLMDHGVAFNVIQALYGHDQRDQELFYRYSSASLYQYICHVSQGIDEMIKILQVEHLSSPMPEKDKAHDKA